MVKQRTMIGEKYLGDVARDCARFHNKDVTVKDADWPLDHLRSMYRLEKSPVQEELWTQTFGLYKDDFSSLMTVYTTWGEDGPAKPAALERMLELVRKMTSDTAEAFERTIEFLSVVHSSDTNRSELWRYAYKFACENAEFQQVYLQAREPDHKNKALEGLLKTATTVEEVLDVLGNSSTGELLKASRDKAFELIKAQGADVRREWLHRLWNLCGDDKAFRAQLTAHYLDLNWVTLANLAHADAEQAKDDHPNDPDVKQALADWEDANGDFWFLLTACEGNHSYEQWLCARVITLQAQHTAVFDADVLDLVYTMVEDRTLECRVAAQIWEHYSRQTLAKAGS